MSDDNYEYYHVILTNCHFIGFQILQQFLSNLDNLTDVTKQYINVQPTDLKQLKFTSVSMVTSRGITCDMAGMMSW